MRAGELFRAEPNKSGEQAPVRLVLRVEQLCLRKWNAPSGVGAPFTRLPPASGLCAGRPNDRRNLSAEELYRALHCSGLEGRRAHLERDSRYASEGIARMAILAATVSGSPTRNAPSGPAMASNCRRVGGDQPRSRPIFDVRCAQPGKNASIAAALVSPTNPIAWTPTLSASGRCPERKPVSR